MLDEKILYEILKSKEERAMKQKEVIKNYPFTLISFTLNTPGVIKDSPLYRRIHNEGIIAIQKVFDEISAIVIYKELIYKPTGPEGFISVDIDPLLLKEATTDIEDQHPLGRIFDIDIFDCNHDQISRSDINKGLRECLICDEKAVNCMRARKHSFKELIYKVEEIGKDYFNKVK